MNSISHIPKAEIHVHLEATITPSLCRKFAKRNKVILSDDFFGSEYAYQWEDFYDFLKKYDIVTSVIHTPEDYYELTYAYLKECASHNVLYVEAMVSSTHAKAKGMTYQSFLDSIQEASLNAERDFGIVSRYLMNGIRHLGSESVQGTAEEVLKNPHPAIVGFGLGGDEFQEWRDEADAVLNAFGKQHNCEYVELFGRKGWGKVLKDINYKEQTRLFAKEINNV